MGIRRVLTRENVRSTATWGAVAALLAMAGGGQVASADHTCEVLVCTPGGEPLLFDGGAEVFNVKAFGAKGDSANDDTAEIQAANDAAAAVGGIVWFPGGIYAISGQLRATTSWSGSGSAGTSIKLTGTAVGNNPTVILGGDAAGHREIFMRDIKFMGPKAAWRNGGAWTTVEDGIRIDGPYRLDMVSASGFDKAFILNSPTGRITISGARSAGNYYASYHQAGGHNLVTNSSFTTNFASFASPADQPIRHLTVQRTHICFGPYGFYEEKRPAGAAVPTDAGWLEDVRLTMTRFEFCGNAMFFSENADADDGGKVRDLAVNWTGWSKGATLQMDATRPDHYEMVFGTTAGRILFFDTYQGGEATRPLADVYVKHQNATWEWLRREWIGGPTFTIGDGRTDTIDIRSLDITMRRGRASIPAGQTSTVVTIPRYLGPNDSIFPVVQPTTSGGLTSKFTLLVDQIAGDPAAGTSFRVSLAAGAPTTAPLSFVWKLDQDTFNGYTHS